MGQYDHWKLYKGSATYSAHGGGTPTSGSATIKSILNQVFDDYKIDDQIVWRDESGTRTTYGHPTNEPFALKASIVITPQTSTQIRFNSAIGIADVGVSPTAAVFTSATYSVNLPSTVNPDTNPSGIADKPARWLMQISPYEFFFQFVIGGTKDFLHVSETTSLTLWCGAAERDWIPRGQRGAAFLTAGIGADLIAHVDRDLTSALEAGQPIWVYLQDEDEMRVSKGTVVSVSATTIQLSGALVDLVGGRAGNLIGLDAATVALASNLDAGNFSLYESIGPTGLLAPTGVQQAGDAPVCSVGSLIPVLANRAGGMQYLAGSLYQPGNGSLGPTTQTRPRRFRMLAGAPTPQPNFRRSWVRGEGVSPAWMNDPLASVMRDPGRGDIKFLPIIAFESNPTVFRYLITPEV